MTITVYNCLCSLLNFFYKKVPIEVYKQGRCEFSDVKCDLLYFGRKFDIRIWVMLTHKLEVWVFKEGHLKTSSEMFDINLIK